jgi:hypothetical protein
VFQLAYLTGIFALTGHARCFRETPPEPDWTRFKDPPVGVRPRFRYWIPDASVEIAPAVQDVARAKDVGAGGLEILPFYGYETTPGYFVPVDWSKYYWGSEPWRKCPRPSPLRYIGYWANPNEWL